MAFTKNPSPPPAAHGALRRGLEQPRDTGISISVSDRVIDIADTVHAELVVCPAVVSVLERIHKKYPTVSFGTFLTAMRLVELAIRAPGGRA